MVLDVVSEKLKRGRPPMGPGIARRHHQSFRIRDAQRELLQTAANANGRSLSEEVEARIESTFVIDGLSARLDRIETMLQRLMPSNPLESLTDQDVVRFERGIGYAVHYADGRVEKLQF